MSRPSARPSATGIHPEWELLFCCARSDAHANCPARIREIVRGRVDWDRLIGLASDHRVLPLLSASLSHACPDAVPPATLAKLRRICSLNEARNRYVTSELLEVLNRLAARGIPAIPFKGPTLATLAYGGLELRQAGDLDILVRKGDAVRAKNLLISHGFRPLVGMTDEQQFRLSHHFILARGPGAIPIELHWQLMRGYHDFRLGERTLFRDASSIRLSGADVPCLPTPELLIYLCAHGTKHCWERLGWICDIAELIRVERDLDWDLVLRKARDLGAGRRLSLGLLLASDLLGAPLAGPIARRIRADATASVLAREVLARYLLEPDSPPGYAEWRRFNARARESRRHRLRFHLKLMMRAFQPNPRDFACLQLPSRLFFLYLGVKPVRLAAKYALNPSGFLRELRGLLGSQS